MQTVVLDTPEMVGAVVAADICRRLRAASQSNRLFLLSCPSGRSARPVFRAMATVCAAESADLSHLVIVMMDEYVVPDGRHFVHVDPTMHNSAQRFAAHEIAGVLGRGRPPHQGVAGSHIWLPDPVTPAAFDGRLESHGGIDFALLASGAGDGHVGLNGAGSPRDSRTRIVPLDEQTRRDNMATFPEFARLDEVPRHGVTVGIETIAGLARAAAMVVWGEDKRQAYRRIAAATGYDPEWPATVAAVCAGATLYADRRAAG